MGLRKEEFNGTIPDSSQLLLSARLPALRASSAASLLTLVAMLSIACEEARVAALRNVLGLTPPTGLNGDNNQKSSFAELFAALRHARGEVKRRGIPPPKLSAVVYTISRKSALARRVRDFDRTC